jgi:hypothetical protein
MRHISLFPWLVGITGDFIHSGVLRLGLFRAEGPLPQGAAPTPSPCPRTRLAGGQHQRLALAWVLLADFPVVILDEPPSTLTSKPPVSSADAGHLEKQRGLAALARPSASGLEDEPSARRRRVPGTPPHQVPRKIGWRLSAKAFRPSR